MYRCSSLYPGSTKYVCGCFQFLCFLGSHIPSLIVDLVCAAFQCGQTMVRLPTLGFLLWHVIVRGDCIVTVRESQHWKWTGRKSPCHTQGSNISPQRTGPNNGAAANPWVFIVTCDCAWGLYRHSEGESALGGKALATPRDQTLVHSALDQTLYQLCTSLPHGRTLDRSLILRCMTGVWAWNW